MAELNATERSDTSITMNARLEDAQSGKGGGGLSASSLADNEINIGQVGIGGAKLERNGDGSVTIHTRNKSILEGQLADIQGARIEGNTITIPKSRVATDLPDILLDTKNGSVPLVHSSNAGALDHFLVQGKSASEAISKAGLIQDGERILVKAEGFLEHLKGQGGAIAEGAKDILKHTVGKKIVGVAGLAMAIASFGSQAVEVGETALAGGTVNTNNLKAAGYKTVEKGATAFVQNVIPVLSDETAQTIGKNFADPKATLTAGAMVGMAQDAWNKFFPEPAKTEQPRVAASDIPNNAPEKQQAAPAAPAAKQNHMAELLAGQNYAKLEYKDMGKSCAPPDGGHKSTEVAAPPPSKIQEAQRA